MRGWAFVTGAAKRIGREIALELARGGYDIIVHYHTSQEEAVRTAGDIQVLGRKVCLIECDLADSELVKKIIPVLTIELGPLAALINNASLFLSDRRDRKNLHIKINAGAPKILAEAFYRHNKRGAIVNLLDVNPNIPGFSHYNQSKKKLAALTVRQAFDFAPRIHVNGVALGPVLPSAHQSKEHFQRLVDKTPLKKPATPQHVAQAVRFLVETTSMTGSILALDGGAHLRRHGLKTL